MTKVITVRRVVDRIGDGSWFVWYPTEDQYLRWIWSGLE